MRNVSRQLGGVSIPASSVAKRYSVAGLTVFFYLLGIPFVLHGYAMNVAMLYWNSMPVLIGFFFIFAAPVLSIRRTMDKESLLLLLALISILLPLVLFGVNYIRDAIKYFLYFAAYLWLFKPHFAKERYYRGFINLILFYLFSSYFLFFIDVVMEFNFHQAFDADIIQLPSQLKIVNKSDAELYFPFYYYVVQNYVSWDLIEYSIVGLPRFYGFSHEPTAFATVLVPLVIISHKLKKYWAVAILLVFLVLVSSYYSLLVLMIILPFLFLPEKKKYWIGALIFIGVIIFFTYEDLLAIVSQSDYTSRRYGNYMNKLDDVFSFELIASVAITENEFKTSTASLISHTLRYGLLSSAAFLAWGWMLFRRSMKPFNKHKILVIAAVLLMAQKGSGLLDPLLLFFINFVNIKDEEPPLS